MKQIDIAIANLLDAPDLQPAETKEIFKMVENLRLSFDQINSSMEQTRNTLNKLTDEQLKTTGSFQACMSLLVKMLPEELVKEQGQKLNEKKPN